MLVIKQYGSKIRPHVSWDLISILFVCKGHLRSTYFLEIVRKYFHLSHKFWRTLHALSIFQARQDRIVSQNGTLKNILYLTELIYRVSQNKLHPTSVSPKSKSTRQIMQIYILNFSKLISKYLCKMPVNNIVRNRRKCIFSKVTQFSICTEFGFLKSTQISYFDYNGFVLEMNWSWIPIFETFP